MGIQSEISVAENGNLRIITPLSIKYLNGRKQIIAPGSLDGINLDAESPVNASLVQMVVKGYAWMRMIEEGKISSLLELAEKTGYHRTHVGRILQMANLAPQITEAIMKGTEPDGLSQQKLKKPLPEEWQEQKEIFGF